jgi:hypothetical protein
MHYGTYIGTQDRLTFEVLTATNMEMTIWDTVPYIMVELDCPDDGGSKHL